MRNCSEDTTDSGTRTPLRESRALHEIMLQPFQASLDAVDDHSPEDASCFSATHETLCLMSPPPSQAPTVAGSLSDQSFESEPLVLSANCHVAENVPLSVDEVQEQSFMCESSLGSEPEVADDMLESEIDPRSQGPSFFLFRMSYLFVTLVVMLADGLQGTHLYVLYEGYGFSVASLYCLGFFTGAVTAPITGPMIDRFGRKRTALLYCALEAGINMLEQFPFLSGLIVSRMVGGITTNLLSTVFEAWVDTEYRTRGFSAEQYETLMRDSIVVSNLAAIASGYLAHILAEAMGPKGPFEGAVTCTALAFVVILFLWTENYGTCGESKASIANSFTELKTTVKSIRADSRILRVCITQGLTMASLHIFIFLWSPVLKDFSVSVSDNQLGLDGHGAPAYGLIFGAFMAAGVLGGLSSPFVRKMVSFILSPLSSSIVPEVVNVEGEGEVRPMAVEFQAASCYILSAFLLCIPVVLNVADPSSFGTTLIAFLFFEFLVGVYFPCEGVIRSIYMPPGTRGSMMTIPRIIVNVAVAFGVVSTEMISRQTALGIISLLMMISGCLQLSLISQREWQSLFGRIENVKRRSMQPIRRISSSVVEFVSSPTAKKGLLSLTSLEDDWCSEVGKTSFPNRESFRPKTE